MVFVADDLGAWLVGLLADAGRRKLTTWAFGDEQERALRQAATAAVLATAAEADPSGGDLAESLVRVISEVFKAPVAATSIGRQKVLEGLQAGVEARLAVLSDASLTGTGQSSADVLGVDAHVVAQRLAGHLVHEIIERGTKDGPLTALADQLNHDVTHLQGERLEGMLAYLSQVVRDALAQSDNGITARPVRLLPRPGLLAGREDLLAELDARLEQNSSAEPQMAVLCGLGGVGKTSIAAEYAHRHQAKLGVVWQFGAEDPATLAAGFGSLAAMLRPGHPGNAVAAVHAVLAASDQDWLLVFDNAPGYQAVRDVLPPAGRGRVLITSQNPSWPGSWALNVPVLDQQAAAGFLLAQTKAAEEEAAGELAAELGGLPLALEQAAAYIPNCGGSIAAYLDLFRQRRGDLLGRGDPARFEKTVATTFALAFDQLLHTARGSVGLLRLLACCAPELIPVRLLLRNDPGLAAKVPPELAALTADPLAADDAIAALHRFSLVSLHSGGMVSVHRLVQAITVAQLPADQQVSWRYAARVLIEAALPADPQLPGNWPDFAVLLPHTLAALSPQSPVMGRVAGFLSNSGDYAAAQLLQQQITDALIQALGGENPLALSAQANLASYTGKAGDAAAARDQYAALVLLREQVSGAEHAATLAAQANLAFWTGTAGDPRAARDQYAALVLLREQVSGAEDTATLAARLNLARWTGEAGDAAAARDQSAALVLVMEQVLGPEHPRTLNARGNLAHWTGEAGDAAAARDQHAVLLLMTESVLGAEHPDTLSVRANLARWTGKAGDPAAARDQLAALVPLRERRLGAEHPDTLSARTDLRYWTRRVDK